MRRDPVRHEERVRVRVKFNPAGAKFFVGPSGMVERRADNGPVEFVIYKSDLPVIMAEVEEDAEMMKAAERQYRLEVKREAAARLGIQVHELSDNFDEWNDDAKLTLQKTVASVEREFHKLTNHAPKPLASAEVIEELPAPETEQDLQIARLAKALSGGGNGEAESLRAQVAELQKTVAELLKRQK